ncbi:unnamed protein product [Pedinophyceae sp. YPF-701]|nr:unnamed protein product [Pedinophyceae sp. YPF-701]
MNRTDGCLHCISCAIWLGFAKISPIWASELLVAAAIDPHQRWRALHAPPPPAPRRNFNLLLELASQQPHTSPLRSTPRPARSGTPLPPLSGGGRPVARAPRPPPRNASLFRGKFSRCSNVCRCFHFMRFQDGPHDLREHAPSPAAVCAGAESGKGSGMSKGVVDTLVLGGLIGMWYFFNIFFNIWNKQVFKVYQFPMTITTLQFLIGSVLACTMWLLRLHPTPKIKSWKVLLPIVPLACVHTIGNLLTNMSLGLVAVSFTHTIKAMEPFFSVLLSAIFLGDIPSLPVLATLFPIIGGVALASASEATFNWPGFISAMGSSLTMQSRNVFSKKFLREKAFDSINMFSIITIMSLCILVVPAIAMEGFTFTTANMTAMGITDPAAVMKRAALAGLAFHSYQQVSYMILQRVSPVTHSISNCVKRVVVIVASVIFFQNPVSQQNAIGTAVALFGVFLYSQVLPVIPGGGSFKDIITKGDGDDVY